MLTNISSVNFCHNFNQFFLLILIFLKEHFHVKKIDAISFLCVPSLINSEVPLLMVWYRKIIFSSNHRNHVITVFHPNCFLDFYYVSEQILYQTTFKDRVAKKKIKLKIVQLSNRIKNERFIMIMLTFTKIIYLFDTV